MAVVFMDTFDGYANDADLTERGWTISGTGLLQSTIKKFGTNAFQANTFDRIDWSITADTGIVYFCFFFYIDNSVVANQNRFFEIYNSSGFQNMKFQCTTDGGVRIVNSSGVQLGDASPTGLLSTEQWHFIEIKARCSNSISADDVIVRVDGVEAVNLPAGTDTNWSGTENISKCRLTNADIGHTANYFDGFLIYDDSPGNITDFTGEYTMELLRPNANGNYSQLTGSDADSTDNYLHVDEAGPDDDTSYVESATAGHRDSYGFGNMAGTPASILAVQVTSVTKTTASNTHKNFVRVGSTDYDSATARTLTAGYKWWTDIWEDDPSTSTNWTKSGLDGAEFGVKVES